MKRVMGVAALGFLWLALWTGAVARTRPSEGAVGGAGDLLPRIQCGAGYTATLYAEGLASPDGLAFDPAGGLYVAEESAGRVSRVGASGQVTPVLSGLNHPEGVAFDDAGNLYIVQDVENGRLLKMDTGGLTTTLAWGLDAPEGVVWSDNGVLYVTESNAQFTANPLDWETHVTAVSAGGVVTRLLTDTLTRSYSGIAIGPDGLLYVNNELSGLPFINQSLITVDPTTGGTSIFATGVFTPEGLRFSPDGGFPLYVVEESTGNLIRVQADGTHAPFCSGFGSIEDVALDADGRFYVSEDSSGAIIRITPVEPPSPTLIYLPLVTR